jgi:putative FmdB family regulatory protein
MPIYEYHCARCGVTREVLHKISETPQVECAHCEGQVLQRMVSAAAFRLKGGGWYETDFKSDKDTKRNLAGDSGGSSGSTSSSSSSGDKSTGGPDAKPSAPAAAPAPATPAAGAS